MIWKCAWLAAAVIEVILFSKLTKQHYIPPTDFCAFAKVCNHTGVALCGVEKKKENSRLFLDECDLYEYNCDNHKDYIETNIENCTFNTTVTISTKPSSITTLVSGIEANVTMTNASKPVNTTESSEKLTPETIITTAASSNVSCVCPIVICPNITTIITSSSDNSNISSINTTVSSTNTAPFINSTEEASIASIKVTNVLKNTTSIGTIANDTSTKAMMKITSTKAVTNVTVTEATTELITIQATINATEATILSSTNTVTTLNVTCTSKPTSTTTEEIITLSVPISESASITTPVTKFVVVKNTTGNEKIQKKSRTKCEYPKHCNRPRTWKTTAKGETRDFYQILRAQFGDRVKVLRDTTHFLRHFAKDFRNDDGFHFGYHNEKMNDIK